MTIFASNRPSARTGRHGAPQKYEEDCAPLSWAWRFHRACFASGRGTRDDWRAGYDADRADRQRRRCSANPSKRGNRGGKMRSRLVPRVVARPIWLCPGRSGRARTPPGDVARQRDAAASRLRVTNVCDPSSMAMDGPLYRPQRGFWVRLLVAPIVSEPKAGLPMTRPGPYMVG